MPWRETTVAFMWVAFAAILLYDLIALVFGGWHATISTVMTDAGRRWWWFPYLVSVVAAVILVHWFAEPPK